MSQFLRCLMAIMLVDATLIAADIYVVNPNPRAALIPAQVPLSQLGLTGAAGVSSSVPAQIIGEKVYLLPGTGGMSSQLITVTSGTPLPPWTPDPSSIQVTRGGVTWNLTATAGLVSMTKNGKTLTITDTVPGSSTLLETAWGPVCAYLKIGSSSTYNQYFFFETGAAEINAASPAFSVLGQRTSIYLSQKRASIHPLALMDDTERLAANSGLPKNNWFTYGYPCDFSMAYDTQQNVGLIVLPTPSGRGLDVGRYITSKSSLFTTTPVKFQFTSQILLPAWTSGYDTTWTQLHRKAVAWSGITRKSFYLGVVETPKAATTGIYSAIYPLVGLVRNDTIPTPPTYEQLFDLDENGTLDKISVQDLDAAANGPDLLTDKWTWDMNNDGDTQAIYQFGHDSAGDRQVVIFGDMNHDANGYTQNQVLDTTELLYPSARLHDWSKDGNFLEGSPFLGGYCQQDWFEDQMVGANNAYSDEPYNRAGGQWGGMNLDDFMDHISKNYDLDGDGDMDLEYWLIRHQDPGYRTRMDGWNRLHADLGDNNLASGLVLDPTTGYIKMFFSECYQEINQNAGGWWGTHNKYLDQTYADPTVNGMFVADGHDYPQSWFDSDGDGYCNTRIYAEIPGLKRYPDGAFDTRVMRMVFRLNNEYHPDIQHPMMTYSTAINALKWDGQILVMTFPRLNNGTEYYGRPWANTPVTFTDPWGHSFKMLAVSIPLNWNGGAVSYSVKSDGAYEIMEPGQSLWSFAYGRDWDQYRMAFFENPNHGNRQGPETLSVGHRQEYNNDASSKPLGFYYSPLFGRVHLWDAEAGDYNHPTGSPTNTKLHFWDRNDDQTADCYEVDGGTFGAPDGVFDKRLWYENGWVTIAQGAAAIKFPYTYSPSKVDFNLNQTAQWAQLQAQAEPFRQQWGTTAASGFLINKGAGLFGQVTYNGSVWSGAPAGYETLRADWTIKAGFDTYHAGNSSEYGLLLQAAGNSYSVFGSLMQSEILTLQVVNQQFTPALLSSLKVLVIPALLQPLSVDEIQTLQSWVHAGGILYLINANIAAGDLANFTAAAQVFGVGVGPDYSVPWGSWAPEAAPSHYGCFDANLLAGTPWLYTSGVKLSGAGTALFSYDNQPIVLERPLGTGKVLVFGTPDLTRDKMLNGPRQWYDRAFNDGQSADAHFTAAPKYGKMIRGLLQREHGGPRPQSPDFSRDCAVDMDDLLMLAGQWLLEGNPVLGDINADTRVDLLDLGALNFAWTGPDLAPPTVPANLQVTSVTDTTARLAWDASSESFCLSGYNIYRNGALHQSSGISTFTDTGLAPSSAYSYRVSASDAAGNESAQGNQEVATTLAPVATNLFSNTLVNYGFEEEGLAGECRGWQDRGPTMSRDEVTVRTGSGAMKVDGPFVSGSYTFCWDFNDAAEANLLGLIPGRQYEFSVWIKSTAASSASFWALIGAAGLIPQADTTHIAGGTDWTKSSYTFTAQGGPASGAGLQLRYALAAGESAWFDDLALTIK